MNDEELKDLIQKFKTGEYDGLDIMKAWIFLEDALECRQWDAIVAEAWQSPLTINFTDGSVE